MKELDFFGYENKKLHLYVFDDVQNAKGVVQIAHGMQESSKTYFEFASFLNKNGYFAVLMDMRAHGKTSESVAKLGHVEKDNFSSIVKDHILLSEKIKEKTSLPLIMFGHSYGSFVTQSYIQNCSLFDKAILSGSSYMKIPLIGFGNMLAKCMLKRKGSDAPAGILEEMSLKSYAKKFHDACWITRDEEKTKEFYTDEFNGTPFTVGFYADMFASMLKLYQKQNIAKISKTAPIFLISGTKDVVGRMGKGARQLLKFYQKNGLNVKQKLYENARHGLVQETNRAEIFNDILEFINY